VTSDNPRSEDPDAIIDRGHVGSARRRVGPPGERSPSRHRRSAALTRVGEATSSWWPARATRRHRPLVTPCSPSTIGSSRSSCYGGPRVESDGVRWRRLSLRPARHPSLDSLPHATILCQQIHADLLSTHDHKAGTPTMGGSGSSSSPGVAGYLMGTSAPRSYSRVAVSS